jgi:hypothetical protein
MALTYNLTKIKDYSTVCFNEDGMKGLTTTLIWMLPVIGMPGITKATAQLVFLRIHLYESLFGPMRGVECFTMGEILSHIGLTANVAFETDAKWQRRILQSWHRTETYRLEMPVLDRNHLANEVSDHV